MPTKSQRTLPTARLAAFVFRRRQATNAHALPALMARHRRPAAAVAAALLVLPVLALTGGVSAAEATPMKFGMDINSIDPQTKAGVKPDYGLFWVGIWNLKSGWGGPDSQMDRAYASGVTPAIQFYYWGDDISKSCVENGCWSDLHDGWKDKANWTKLAQQLVDHLKDRMKGKPVVVVLESEFNKGGIGTYEPFDGYLADKAKFIKASYPAAQVVLGFGNWGQDSWGTFDRAAAASDMTGIQAMRGSTRNSLTSYYELVDSTLDGANRLKALFGKPVFVSDIALSTYPEPEYLGHQQKMVAQLFTRLPDLKAAGVQGMVYRSFKDHNMDLANYYGEAERHWGLAWGGNLTWKPSMKTWADGIKAERANPARATGSADAAGSAAVLAVEAEHFATRTAGGAQSDSSASGGKFWNLWSNGHVAHAVDFTEPGVYELRVRARGNTADGVAPHLVASLGGTAAFEADPPAGAWQWYHAWVRVDAPGVREFRVAFTNDAVVNGQDRNLLLDRAEVEWRGPLPQLSEGNSTRVEAEDFADLGSGQSLQDKAAHGGLAVRLATNGVLSTPVSLEQGRHALRVVARGVAQGAAWPQLDLRLDGQSVGVRSVEWSTYKVYYADADVRTAGRHTLAVAFVNDVPPANGADLALVLDRAVVENLGPLANRAPTPDFVATLGGLGLHVDASMSKDADGDTLRFRWDFGDGTRAEGAVADHAYAAGGTYLVALTVEDGRSSASSSQNVRAVRPNHAPEPTFAWSADGLAVRVDGAGSHDDDGDAITHRWFWGDGKVSAASATRTASHTYAKGGTYNISLEVRDAELGNRTTQPVALRAPVAPSPARLVLVEGVTVTPTNATPTQRVAMSFRVCNEGGTAITLEQLGVVADDRTFAVGPLTLEPGQMYDFAASGTFRIGSHPVRAFAMTAGSTEARTIAVGDGGGLNPAPLVVRPQ